MLCHAAHHWDLSDYCRRRRARTRVRPQRASARRSGAFSPAAYVEQNACAEVALTRLSGMAGLVASSNWLIYAAIRKEALLTPQLEGTQATLKPRPMRCPRWQANPDGR